MFNAPRRTAGTSLASSAFLNNSSSGGVGGFDPLAQSTPIPSTSGFGEVDPWSAVPSPALSGTPRREEVNDAELALPVPSNGSITAREGLNQFISDPPSLYLSLADQLDPSGSGYISLASVQRLFLTSRLPASTVEKIIGVTARDQSSLSRHELFCALALVALAQTSPDSSEISIERLSSSLLNLPLPNLSTTSPSPATPGPETSPHGFAVTPGVESASPWDTAPRLNGNGNGTSNHYSQPGMASADESIAEKGYWKKLEKVEVSLIPEKEGWFLQKYQIESDKRNAGALSRRYTDFVWLLDILVKRYPFRLLPSLPPKRIGPDATFLETRRKALKRFINMLVNHPVTRDDGALNVFLTEPNFEAWRKRTKVSTDEESASKRLTPAQEMGIPADLEEKLGLLRDHLPALLASYQKLVVLAERSLARFQAASADASRIALSLRTVGEEMPVCCYRCVPGGGHSCSLCVGVGRGLGEVGESWTRVAEEGEQRAVAILLGNIEALKSQRDLYLAFRDLFIRHDKLSKDSVESLGKKVETRTKKIESLKTAGKPGWEVEVDKLVAASDTDTASINTLLARRVFVRACMWHELAVVFHSRQAAQATLGWREFAAQQEAGDRALVGIWQALKDRLESMPVE
ncbi:hypothetical protein BCR39DRAFT_470616 [Naematelia encephala]|uniref:Sorting nexin MVP1 n=1 Tax=Naematelia encephala TaxID=71784 RepID=A0A1Y2AUG0_9TREE|nr:hypothetical protein BCR39DRAFT_470616 [Naematelia encephala]